MTVAVTDVLDHHGDTIVRGRYDGNYDKTNLPDELISSNYFTVRDGKIVTLISPATPPPATEIRPPGRASQARGSPAAMAKITRLRG